MLSSPSTVSLRIERRANYSSKTRRAVSLGGAARRQVETAKGQSPHYALVNAEKLNESKVLRVFGPWPTYRSISVSLCQGIIIDRSLSQVRRTITVGRAGQLSLLIDGRRRRQSSSQSFSTIKGAYCSRHCPRARRCIEYRVEM